MLCHWWKHGNVNAPTNTREVFIDSIRIQGTELQNEFLFKVKLGEFS